MGVVAASSCLFSVSPLWVIDVILLCVSVVVLFACLFAVLVACVVHDPPDDPDLVRTEPKAPHLQYQGKPGQKKRQQNKRRAPSDDDDDVGDEEDSAWGMMDRTCR